MVYLHKSVFQSHGYLSSANCHVDSRWVLKVSGFALHAFRKDKQVRINIRFVRIFMCCRTCMKWMSISYMHTATVLFCKSAACITKGRMQDHRRIQLVILEGQLSPFPSAVFILFFIPFPPLFQIKSNHLSNYCSPAAWLHHHSPPPLSAFSLLKPWFHIKIKLF